MHQKKTTMILNKCANCASSFDRRNLRAIKLRMLNTSCTDTEFDELEIIQALSYIYEIPITEFEAAISDAITISENNPESDAVSAGNTLSSDNNKLRSSDVLQLSMCQKCAPIVAEMYRSHISFNEMSRSGSFLSTFRRNTVQKNQLSLGSESQYCNNVSMESQCQQEEEEEVIIIESEEESQEDIKHEVITGDTVETVDFQPFTEFDINDSEKELFVTSVNVKTEEIEISEIKYEPLSEDNFFQCNSTDEDHSESMTQSPSYNEGDIKSKPQLEMISTDFKIKTEIDLTTECEIINAEYQNIIDGYENNPNLGNNITSDSGYECSGGINSSDTTTSVNTPHSSPLSQDSPDNFGNTLQYTNPIMSNLLKHSNSYKTFGGIKRGEQQSCFQDSNVEHTLTQQVVYSGAQSQVVSLNNMIARYELDNSNAPPLPKRSIHIHPSSSVSVSGIYPEGNTTMAPSTSTFTTSSSTLESSNIESRGKINTHNNNEKLPCGICSIGIGISESGSEIGHRNKHYERSQQHCEYCGKNFCNDYFLRRHIRLLHPSYHGRIYSCKQCPEKFCTVETLEVHAIVHGGNPYYCQSCERVFFSWECYDRHRGVHMVYFCYQCGERFEKSGEIVVHRCEGCNQEQPSESPASSNFGHAEVRLQLKKKILCNSSSEVPCKSSSRVEWDVSSSSGENTAITIPTVIPTSVSPGQNICAQTIFPLPPQHLGGTPEMNIPFLYQFNKDSAEPQRQQLFPPIINNTNEYQQTRKYPNKGDPIVRNKICDICGKGFGRNSHLKRHRLIHSDVQLLHVCPICKSSFTTTDSHKAHMLKCTKGNPWTGGSHPGPGGGIIKGI